MAWSFALPGDFLYVLIFSLVAHKFIPVFGRELIFMVFDESFQVGLTGDLRRTVCPFMSDHGGYSAEQPFRLMPDPRKLIPFQTAMR